MEVVRLGHRSPGKRWKYAPVINEDNELAGILRVDDLIDLFSEQIADLARLFAREQKREREKRG